ncbi:MAG: hypothetical protein KatS3mg116_1956 [Elioraea sp.]|nr:MAG: hypothetical protein KatS3mg116_1956 [Elioraea sp.]
MIGRHLMSAARRPGLREEGIARGAGGAAARGTRPRRARRRPDQRRAGGRGAALLLAAGVLAAAAAPAAAWPDRWFDSGRLLGTAGVVQVEGAGGGGLTPWALIAGYGTRDAVGASARGTAVRLPDYALYSPGIAIGLFDRIELSYAHLGFDTGSTGEALGLGSGFTFRLDVLGAKLRLFGDAVYDQDRWWPQVAVGMQYKSNSRDAVLRAIGARRASDVDVYVSATKLFLAESILANATLRFTRANQLGILGFGGDRNDRHRPQVELSGAWLINRHVAIGAEYRMKPDNLGFAREDDWLDVFVALFVTKNVSLTAAWLEAGSIATRPRQRGPYLSLTIGF